MIPSDASQREETTISRQPGFAPPAWMVWATGYLIVLCALYLVWAYNLLDHYNELVDLGKISSNSVSSFVLWLVVSTLMFCAWGLAIAALRGRHFRDVWLPVIGLTVIVYIAFILIYPATAIDVFIYAARSHLLTDYGLNPSTIAPRQFWETDPFVHFASWEWSSEVSPYGPLWNVVAAPATAFDGEHIRTSILLFKGIMVASIVGIGVLIHEITRMRRADLATAAMVAWLWCPVVLWEGVANSHNDVVLLLPVLAAIWCWDRGYLGWVVPLIVVSALIKVVTLIILPVAMVAIVARTGINARLLRLAAQTALISIGVAWIAFTPFYDLDGAINAVQSQRDVWVTSPALLLDRIDKALGWGLNVRDWYGDFGMVVTIVITVAGTIVAWRRPELLPRIAFEQLFWFLLLATTNLRPWYGLWLIALVIILPPGFTWLRTAAWIVGGQFSYALGAWVRHWFAMDAVERAATNFVIALGPVLIVMVWWAMQRINDRAADQRQETPSSPAEPASG